MVWENDPEEGAVRLRRDEENEKHLFCSWNFPKSQNVPTRKRTPSCFPYVPARMSVTQVWSIYWTYWCTQLMAIWASDRVTALSSHKLSTYSLLCCPFEREDGSGWGHGVLEAPWNECRCGHHGGCSLASCCLVWREFQEGSGIDFEWSDAILKTLLFGRELVCIKAACQRNMHYQLLCFCIKHYFSSLQSD